jgi:hypothetical protein
MSDEKPDNQWLLDAIERAKKSALPVFLRTLVEDPDDEVAIEALCDAIEVSLLAITGDVTEEKLRNALRAVAESLAANIGCQWQKLVDALLGTMEWLPPDKSTHVIGGR